MVVGPNGAGKSTVVCAILLGLAGSMKVNISLPLSLSLSSSLSLSLSLSHSLFLPPSLSLCLSLPIYLFLNVSPPSPSMFPTFLSLPLSLSLTLSLTLLLSQSSSRSKELRDYIKHGEERGSIEITLFKAGPSDQDLVVRRELTSNDKSVWKLDGMSSRLSLSLPR